MNKILFLLFSSFFVFLMPAKAQSPDIIGIKVFTNPEHFTVNEWYARNVGKASPSTVYVDGYKGLRDGNTIYINAAVAVPSQEKIYTNIYVVSYNKSADQETLDIFGKIMSNWKFNVMLMGEDDYYGKCVRRSDITETEKVCVTDFDCSSEEYCNGLKAKIVRDLRRYGDKKTIAEALRIYKEQNGNLPALQAGTYMGFLSFSTWPSWQQTLGAQIGLTMPVDPINYMECNSTNADPISCWNEAENNFDFDINSPGDKSHYYRYWYSPGRTPEETLQVLPESGYEITP